MGRSLRTQAHDLGFRFRRALLGRYDAALGVVSRFALLRECAKCVTAVLYRDGAFKHGGFEGVGKGAYETQATMPISRARGLFACARLGD